MVEEQVVASHQKLAVPEALHHFLTPEKHLDAYRFIRPDVFSSALTPASESR